MRVQNKELWEFVLAHKDSLKPKMHYMYKTGTVSTSHIATDETHDFNTGARPNPSASDVVNIVDMVINTAARSLGKGRDNKTAVMCEVLQDNCRPIQIYFSSFDSQRTICTEIRSEHKGDPIP